MRNVCEKNYIQNPYKCCCEYGKYLASIMDNLAITCDEIKNAEAKSNDEEPPSTNFSEKNITCKIQMLFTNYHFIIYSVQHSLSSDKISTKKATFITIPRHK